MRGKCQLLLASVSTVSSSNLNHLIAPKESHSIHEDFGFIDKLLSGDEICNGNLPPSIVIIPLSMINAVLQVYIAP